MRDDCTSTTLMAGYIVCYFIDILWIIYLLIYLYLLWNRTKNVQI